MYVYNDDWNQILLQIVSKKCIHCDKVHDDEDCIFNVVDGLTHNLIEQTKNPKKKDQYE